MDDKERIVRRVQKLLALAQSTNPHEAASAAAKAQELLLAHKLSMSELAAAEREAEDPMVNDSREMGMRATKWKLSLAGTVARAYSCRFCFMSGTRDRKAKMFFVGRKNDVEVAWYMYGYLANCLESLAPKAFKDEYKQLVLAHRSDDAFNLHPVAWQNDFKMAAIAVLKTRMVETEEAFMSAHDECRALVVASKAEVSKFFKQVFPRLRKSEPGRSIESSSAAEAGAYAGYSIELRKGLASSGASRGMLSLTGGGL